jgi:hypothetical protein
VSAQRDDAQAVRPRPGWGHRGRVSAAGPEPSPIAAAVTPPGADGLAALLAPYADPAPGQAGRLVDVPVSVGRQVLDLLPADLVGARLNLVRPAMTWLVPLAAELPLGRLVGSLTPGRGPAVFDGIQVDAGAAGELAARVAAAYPATGDLPGALQAATAESWTSWTAQWPIWSGPGIDLLTQPLPPGSAVVGLWWD